MNHVLSKDISAPSGTPVPAALFHVLSIGLALLPLIGALVPRFLGFAPGILALGGIILYRIAYGRLPAFGGRIFGLLLAVCGLCLASAYWSFDAGKTIERTAKLSAVLFSGGALCVLIAALPADHLRGVAARTAKLFTLSAILSLGVLVIDFYAGGLIYAVLRDMGDAEINYSHMNRNVVAITFFLPFSLWFLRKVYVPNLLMRLILLCITAILVIAVFLATNSQSVQLAAAIMLILYVAFPYRQHYAWLALALIVIAALSLAPWIAQWMFNELAAHAGDNMWLWHGYAQDRMEIWDFVARKALEQPFSGFGLEATRDIAKFDTQMLYAKVDHVLHPHNFVIQLWVEFGVWGAALASAAFAVMLSAIYECPRSLQRFFLPLSMALLVVAAISYGLWQAWWLGLFMALLALSVLIARASHQSAADLDAP